MDFAPNDEQRLIAEGFAKIFVDQGYPAQNESGDAWLALEELGLLSAAYPEARDGIGAGIGDLVHTLVEVGRAAAPEPVIGAAILPGLALSRAGVDAPDTPEGQLCLATDVSDLTVTDCDLQGVLRVVPGADVADAVIVALADDRLAVVPMDMVQRESYRLVDGRGAADLHLKSVPLAAGAPVLGISDWLKDAAATAFAADALGAMLALREMTQGYLKERSQFGRPLASFQSLQHAMVDIYHDTEHFFSLVHLAARTCDGGEEAMRVRTVSAVKRYLGGRMRRAAASAIQLHGGIGVTEEYMLGRFVKRLMVADMLNGSADAHGARLARLIAKETRLAKAPILEEEKVA
jgi:alkylation response protein AidB-like acyl-CoA dehydrogenase